MQDALTRALEGLRNEPASRVALSRLAQLIGRGLAQWKVPEVARIRSLLASHQRGVKDAASAVGGMIAMGELCLGYASELQELSYRRKVQGVRSGSLSLTLLGLLRPGPRSSGQLARDLDRTPAQVSRLLRKLRQHDLVSVALLPEPADQRERFYELTVEGITALEGYRLPDLRAIAIPPARSLLESSTPATAALGATSRGHAFEDKDPDPAENAGFGLYQAMTASLTCTPPLENSSAR